MRENQREPSGFPSPAEDHVETTLDSQQLLVPTRQTKDLVFANGEVLWPCAPIRGRHRVL